MVTHINGELTTLATLWHITRTDGVELFITDHDLDIVFAGDTYAAASGIARTAIESASDMSVDNLDVVGILGGELAKNDLLAGHYDFAQFDIFSVNWVDPDGFGKIQHRFGTIGEIQVKDGSYTGELRGMMQLLERNRGKVWAPDCRANLFSPLTDPFSGRATGCGLTSTAFEEFAQVVSVTNDRQFIVNEFSQEIVTPAYGGIAGDVRGVHEVDGKVEMVLDIADGSPLRPIHITDRAGLEAMANDLNGHYVLDARIDLTNTAWVPIGDDATPFRGTFDGQGYHVYRFKSEIGAGGSGPVGFFGTLAGTVRRFGVESAIVKSGSASDWCGCIAGRLVGEESGDHPLAGAGKIENCWAFGGVTSDNDRAGGLVGEQGAGTIIRSCWVNCAIFGTIGTDVGAAIGRSQDGTRVIDGLRVSREFSRTGDLGNISGGNAAFLDDDEWDIAANWPSPYDLVDQLEMGVITDEAVTVKFDMVSGNDKITRTSGNWLRDTRVRVGDHITFAGTSDAGQMTPGTSVVIDAGADTFTRTVGSWISDGFVIGQTVTVTGSASNNGSFVIDALSATVLSVAENITVSEGAQVDLDIDWTANNDAQEWLVKVLATTILFVDGPVQSAQAIACTYSITGPPRSRDPGRF